MTKRALVVVDIQNDYFPGGRWTLTEIEKAAANARRVLDRARERGDRIIHIRHEFQSDDAPFFAPGSEGSQIHAELAGLDGETVITKNNVNAFLQTPLKELLERDAIQDVTIVGNMSHMCIDAAARAASDLGYKPTVIHDACATLDLEFNGVKVPAAQVHAAFMSALSFAYAQLKSTDEFLAESAVSSPEQVSTEHA